MMVKSNDFRASVLIAAATLLAACLLVAVAAGKPAQAAFPGTNGKIVFLGDRDSTTDTAGNVLKLNDDIYVMNPDGSQVTRLTSDPTVDGCPAVSPSGKEIAFLSNRDHPGAFEYELYVMDAKDDTGPLGVPDGEGDNLRRLTDPASPLVIPCAGNTIISWSPDGKQIAFTGTDQTGNPDIYVMPADGSEPPTRLTSTPGSDFGPVFSPVMPDGTTKIAFVSRRDHQDRPFDGNSNELYVMDADGSNPVRLTDNAASDAQPDFSPDGAKIVFRSNRDGNGELYVMNAKDSGDLQRLTYTPATPDQVYLSGTNEQWPNYSPDGKKIVFWRGGGVSGTDGGASGHQSDFDSELYVMNAAPEDPVTNKAQNITNTSTWGEIQPDWGPTPIKKK